MSCIPACILRKNNLISQAGLCTNGLLWDVIAKRAVAIFTSAHTHINRFLCTCISCVQHVIIMISINNIIVLPRRINYLNKIREDHNDVMQCSTCIIDENEDSEWNNADMLLY